ncbi:MAG: 6-phosphofructokinase, partial [Flavobacteriales bacterium CG03_land_8_20_14_0_80_35_15]
VKAVELLLDGHSNLMVGIVNTKIESCSFKEALAGHHNINKELIRVADIMSV